MAIASGCVRFVYIGQFHAIYALRGVLRRTLNGFGYSRFTMVESLISVVLVRVLWMSLVYPLSPSLEMAYATYLISAIVSLVIVGPMLAFVFHQYKKGVVTKI